MTQIVPLASWWGIFNGDGSPLLKSLFTIGPEVLIELAEDRDGEYKAATLVVDCMLSRQYAIARMLRRMMPTYWRFAECAALTEICLNALADRELGVPDWKECTRAAVRKRFPRRR